MTEIFIKMFILGLLFIYPSHKLSEDKRDRKTFYFFGILMILSVLSIVIGLVGAIITY